MRLLFCFVLFCFVVHCSAISDIFVSDRNNINSKVEELIPKDARKFYNELSSEDKEILKDVVENGQKFATVDALLDNIKTRSSILYDKANSIIKEFNDSLDSLGPEAKKFVDDLIAHIRQLSPSIGINQAKEELFAIIERFKKLDPTSREELKNAFPVVTGVFQNPIFQSLLSLALGINLDVIEDATPDSGATVTIEPPIVTVTPSVTH
uniref:Fatty-acid and retinol-binding protein 1 n=1 Tax=Panagrolaimus sp. JU765 TaxID=591449 RepID=A0AC34PUA9_9BILA